jgi:tetratricopeptide (TPR) repeat protein
MPLPASDRLPLRGSETHFALRFRLYWPVILALLALALACAPPAPRTPPPAVPPELHPYLLPPTHGYPLSLDARTRDSLERGYDLLLYGRWEEALGATRELLDRDPDLAPARVLAGQALLVARRFEEATEMAAPALFEHSEYLAAQMLLGRAADERGHLLEAFELFQAAGDASEVARERAALLRPRALEISAHRVRDALHRGRVEEAEGSLSRLESWAPDEPVTLEAAVEVARARGDRRRELVALRGLTGQGGERSLLERRGELELQVGSAAAGLEIFEHLQSRYPDDPTLAEQVANAKFRWRLHVLPQEVQEKAGRHELTRADYATLLYWLVPGVRTAAPQVGRIATDVLEHPHRQEIIRVVNLQLMDVDPALREFGPDRRLSRVAGLEAVLRAMARSTAPPDCVAEITGNPTPSRWQICATAARCGLIREEPECLPEATVSGAEALDWIRRTVAP